MTRKVGRGCGWQAILIFSYIAAPNSIPLLPWKRRYGGTQQARQGNAPLDLVRAKKKKKSLHHPSSRPGIGISSSHREIDAAAEGEIRENGTRAQSDVGLFSSIAVAEPGMAWCVPEAAAGREGERETAPARVQLTRVSRAKLGCIPHDSFFMISPAGCDGILIRERYGQEHTREGKKKKKEKNTTQTGPAVVV